MRHGTFIAGWLVYSMVRIGMMVPENQWHRFFPGFFEFVCFWSCITLGFSYLVTYVLVPYFAPKRQYGLLAASVLISMALFYGVVVANTYYGILPIVQTMTGVPGRRVDWPSSLIRTLGNPPLVCGLLLSLKSLKNWYLEELEHQQLLQETTKAELQVLKAQIHPHFLFNTLNNIYSFSLNRPAQASDLVHMLRRLLSYMITECNQPLVLLKDELAMIHNYLGLERVRYGNRLSLNLDIRVEDPQYYLTPLLLLPFVENSFKHGASQTLEHPWIRLTAEDKDGELHFLISNSKPPEPYSHAPAGGIGLKNVKKRLELLYPGTHSLKITDSIDFFEVELRLPLLHAIEIHPSRPSENQPNVSTHAYYAV